MDLKQAALDVRERAYAPYSRFKVGAAILSVEGHLHVGCLRNAVGANDR